MTREEAIKKANDKLDSIIYLSECSANPGLRKVYGDMAEWLSKVVYLAEIGLKTQHAAEKNEPLTLDELRVMKDEPVYLKVFDPHLDSGWHIIKVVTGDKIIYRGWQLVYTPIDGLGVNYNLYRRKPEEMQG